MTQQELLTELDLIIEDSKTAVLASVDKNGNPHMRWMTPTMLKDRGNTIFAVTSPKFEKTVQLTENPDVEWLFQTRNLEKVINIRGVVNIVDNSSIKSEVLEALGRRLTAFWKLNEVEQNLTVLETVIQDSVFFIPMKGVKYHVKFS
jgi:pyridoxamine 5'-phosphate oxidase